MAISSGKKARKSNSDNSIEYTHAFKEVKPINFIQDVYLNAIKHNSIIFGIGSTGTGKT